MQETDKVGMKCKRIKWKLRDKRLKEHMLTENVFYTVLLFTSKKKYSDR